VINWVLPLRWFRRLRLVPPNGEMVQTARDVEICFGD